MTDVPDETGGLVAAGSGREHSFRPGVRLSVVDAFVLLSGAVLAWLVASRSIEFALLTVTVVLHFFLFCNVFRIARALELAWSAWFVGWASLSLLAGVSWGVVAPLVAVATCWVIWRGIQKPSYHGLLWQRWNPGLRDWWLHSDAPPPGPRG